MPDDRERVADAAQLYQGVDSVEVGRILRRVSRCGFDHQAAALGMPDLTVVLRKVGLKGREVLRLRSARQERDERPQPYGRSPKIRMRGPLESTGRPLPDPDSTILGADWPGVPRIYVDSR